MLFLLSVSMSKALPSLAQTRHMKTKLNLSPSEKEEEKKRAQQPNGPLAQFVFYIKFLFKPNF